jgi:hypothetical protein
MPRCKVDRSTSQLPKRRSWVSGLSNTTAAGWPARPVESSTRRSARSGEVHQHTQRGPWARSERRAAAIKDAKVYTARVDARRNGRNGPAKTPSARRRQRWTTDGATATSRTEELGARRNNIPAGLAARRRPGARRRQGRTASKATARASAEGLDARRTGAAPGAASARRSEGVEEQVACASTAGGARRDPAAAPSA